MLNNQNILFLSSSFWDGLWTRKHIFMKMLSRYNKIIYVEREPTIATPISDPDYERFFPNILPTQRWINENMILYTPPCLLPMAHSKSRLTNFFNQLFMLLLIKKIIKKYFHNEDFIIWTTVHSIPLIFKNLQAKLKIFDCTDEISEFSHVNKKLVAQWEKDLIKSCDIVFVTSETLLKNKKKLNKNTYYIPNGVEFDVMNSINKTVYKCPNDIKGIDDPKVIFIGNISEWIDLKIIYDAANKFRNYNFIIIGPIKKNIKVRNYNAKNLFFLGKKKYDLIPSYIQHSQVCISTFKINELSKSINPLKVYEYMATGKPVIASFMPELSKYQDCLMLYRTKKDFFNFLDKYTRIDNRYKRQKRIEIAKLHSWDILLENMCGVINNYINSNEK